LPEYGTEWTDKSKFQESSIGTDFPQNGITTFSEGFVTMNKSGDPDFTHQSCGFEETAFDVETVEAK
jgi:hypothetical protein